MNPASRNKHLLLWSSLLSLALLFWAAYEENVRREWRRLQHAAASPTVPVDVRLRQVVVPALGIADRCVSCHVGMAAGETTLPGHPVLKPHPDVGHDPGSFGCTTCHAGQGRATDRGDAHGDVHFWPKPMIPRRYAQAGCGACHTHLQVPNLDALRAGASALERHDCLACHRLNGRGGTLRSDGGGMEGPDLSRIGARGYEADWYEDHLARRARGEKGPWASSFGPISEADRAAIAVLLDSTVGAPLLVEAKALFHSQGCRGCHKVGGVGGDDGPDLTRVGERDPGRLDMSHVPGEKGMAGWLAEHFRSPSALVPGSRMPALGLSEEEISLLTLYMLSLRRGDVPEAYWPKDRIRAERFGEREFAKDGATLYGTFCAACHGPAGEGMRYPGMPPFPAIANPDFLALASDDFIAATVRHGRPGRRMPAWGGQEGGLRPAELLAVVAHVRSLGGIALEPDPREARWAKGDVAAGARLYAMNCALCHGDKGEGSEGTALNDRVFLGAATDTYLVETVRRGRRDTTMHGFGSPTPVRPAFSSVEIESIVAFIRSWEAGS